MSLSTRLCIFAFGCFVLNAQTITLIPTPATLIAGGGAQTLTISSNSLAAIPLTASWNGQSVPVQMISTPGSGNSVFTVSLTAADLASSQLGQFALYDGRSNTLIGSVAVPVVYPVSATATLFDASRGLLYLTTLGPTIDSRFPANSLVAIDTLTSSVVKTLSLGAAGGPIALSDDSSVLYVAVAPNIVRQVDPSGFTAVADFPLVPRKSILGITAISALAVQPGAPHTLAVQYFADAGQLGIFDSGVERANTAIAGYKGMLFSPDGKYLFVGNLSFFPATTNAFLIDSTGIPAQTPLSAPGGPPVTIANGTLYTSNGISIAWQTMQVTGNLDGASAVAVDVVNSRLLATFGTAPTILQAFDLVSQDGFGTLSLPLTPVNLYRFGIDGLIEQSAASILLFHTPLAGPPPSILPNGTVSAASFLGTSVAPGEIISIFGSSLGPATGSSFTLNGEAVAAPAGMEVWFGSDQGTVLFASSGQMNAVAPFALTPGTVVLVQVWNNGIPSAQIPLTVVSAAAALLTRDGSGKGLVAMVNQDGTINAPAPRGAFVILYGTGGGVYPGARDGTIEEGISWLSASVQVTIGGQNAQVLYAGEAPQLVSSAFQLNVVIPAGVTPGPAVPVVVTVGGQTSAQGVTIEVR